MVDIARNTAGVTLPRTVSREIWANATEGSAVMSLANQIVMPGSGVSVPLVTAEPTAAWVAETAEKPVSNPTVGNKTITPYKLAVIETFSNEFRRDMDALYEALVARLPMALAHEFDRTVFHGAAPGSGFDVLDGAPAVALGGSDVYADLVAVDSSIASNNGVLNGWALAPSARGTLIGAVDGTGRPLLLNNIQTEGGVANLLGGRVVLTRAALDATDTPDTIGFAGDWTSAFYGTVEGIQIRTSEHATLTGVGNLFQRNMFAVLAEVEIGFAVRNVNHFVKITAAA